MSGDASREKLSVSVIPIGHRDLTKADLTVFLHNGYEMVEQGLAGACMPVQTDSGEIVVVLLDLRCEQVLLAFGKAEGWYYAFDAGWAPMAQGRLIDDVLSVLPRALEYYLPRAANAF